MKCCDQLDDYLDGDLSPEEMESFLKESSRCEDCQAAINASTSLNETLRAAWSEVRSPWMEQGLSPANTRSTETNQASHLGDGVEDSRGITWWNRSTVRWCVAIACTLLMAFVGWRAAKSWTDVRDQLPISQRPLQTPEEENQSATTDKTTTESTVIAERYDTDGIEIKEPHLGYKAVDNDEYTLVMVYRIPDEQLVDSTEPDASPTPIDFD